MTFLGKDTENMKNYNYVNTKMGTHNYPRYSNGNCYPIMALPHGMASFTLQTDSNINEINTTHWFYSPYHKSFEGVRLSHMPSPWTGEYGKLVICGQRGEFVHHRNIYYAYYDNEKSVIEPAYINVRVTRDRYSLEMTPTNSGAVIHIKFDEGNGPYRLVFLGEQLELEYDEKSGYIIGKTIQCDTDRYYEDSKKVDLTEYFAIKADCDFYFDKAEDVYDIKTNVREFECRLATSFLSQEQAILNFENELEKETFQSVRQKATDIWEEYLSKIQIEDSDEDKKKTFYSCMYRAALWPRRFYEIGKDKKPYHINFANGKIVPGYLYVDNGFWDTFRTLYPYYSIIDPRLYAQMAEGFYNYYVDCGWLPKWLAPFNLNCMPGMLVEATMSDAIVKEIISGELAENVLNAMLKDGEYVAEKAGEGRVGLAAYRKYGYVPYTIAGESVNETLDNSYGDYCIAAAAQKLGKTDIAKKYFEYADNYKKLFDKETGFMRPKDENGSFRNEEFDPYAWGRDYTEGCAWHNSFGVYHDIKGLDELYGGKLEDKIDELMSSPPIYNLAVPGYGKAIHEMAEMYECHYGQCAMCNQPSFHIPFIYSELGNLEKTSLHTHNLAKLFTATVDGYPGDDDNGTMSAWYLLCAMGLYQMSPSKPEFDTALPLFDKMKVTLGNGNILNVNKQDYCLEKMSGRISYFELMQGGELAKMTQNKK